MVYCIHMDVSLDSVKQIVKANQSDLARHYFVRRLGVFGSVVRGTQHAQSDIDMLVEFTQPVSMFQFLALEDKLTELLGKRIDLATPNALKSAVRDDVLGETVYV